MLTYLAIENIALVDSLTLSFDAPLTALTGESGSGKSILLDCLQFVAGSQRSRAELGAEATEGRVEAQFHLAPEEARLLATKLEAHGIPVDDELVLRRTLDPSGRSRCFVQGHLVPRQLLAEVAAELLEFTNQGDSLSLRSPRQQLDLVDQAAGLGQRREEFSRIFGEFTEKRSTLERAKARLVDGESRRDFLEYQLEELRTVPLDAYAEDVEAVRRFDTERERSERVEALLDDLGRGDDSLVRKIYALRKRSDALLRDQELAEAFSSAVDALESAEARLLAVLERPELAPDEVERRRARISRVDDLARKHRTGVGELGERAHRLSKELEDLTTLADHVERMEEETKLLETDLARRAAELHDARVAACETLSKRVRAELGRLGLRSASLHFEVTGCALGPTGATAISLLYCSHTSMQPRLLGKTGSGGELGRVLLALRLATEKRRPLLVLDEIDAGVGGKAAQDIADSLRRASEFGQLLVVTHWPQVAAAAPCHIGVAKIERSDTVRSVAERLDGPSRVAELARMLGGSAESAHDHARSLLAGPAEKKRSRTALREVA